MTAAVYRWFLGLSGADLLVGWAVLCCLASIAAYALYELGALLWRTWIEYRIRRHVKQVWPIPFVEKPISHRDPWPLAATLAFVALVLAIMFRCGVPS